MEVRPLRHGSVRAGYKQTEVGVIPEDWSVKLLSVFSDVKTGPFGTALHERDYVSDGTPIITVEHLDEYGVVHQNLPLVSDSDRNRLSSYSLCSGDIVFSRVGSVDRNALIRDSEDGWLFSGRLLRVRVLRGDVYPPYLSYHFHSESFKQRVRAVAVGQTMASLNTRILKGVCAVLPTEPEQRAIAVALSDVDALLGGLDRLIAKKRDLKQAAMQQLLTGQTRLPGFHGEWEVKPLKYLVTRDRFAIVDGPFGSQLKVDEYVESGVPVIEMEHLSDDFITERIERCITPRKFDDLKRSAVYPGDIIISKTGSLGKLGLMPDRVERGLITSRLAKITLDPSHADRRFVFQCLLKLRSENYWEKVSQGGTMQILGIGMLQNAPIPSIAVPEQTAIAAVLSDMDAELAALEARRAKTRNLKQAMMQELLTGKTRLVSPGGAHA